MHQHHTQQQAGSSSSSSKAGTALQLRSRTGCTGKPALQARQLQGPWGSSLHVHAAAALAGSLAAGLRKCRCLLLLLLLLNPARLVLLLLAAARLQLYLRCLLALLRALLLLRVLALLKLGTAMQSTRLWHWRRCSTTCLRLTHRHSSELERH
jgi:hypothetical protein